MLHNDRSECWTQGETQPNYQTRIFIISVHTLDTSYRTATDYTSAAGCDKITAGTKSVNRWISIVSETDRARWTPVSLRWTFGYTGFEFFFQQAPKTVDAASDELPLFDNMVAGCSKRGTTDPAGNRITLSRIHKFLELTLYIDKHWYRASIDACSRTRNSAWEARPARSLPSPSPPSCLPVPSTKGALSTPIN